MNFMLDYPYAKFQSNLTPIWQEKDQLNFKKTGFPTL